MDFGDTQTDVSCHDKMIHCKKWITAISRTGLMDAKKKQKEILLGKISEGNS